MNELPLDNAGQALLLIEHLLGYRPRSSVIAFALESEQVADGPGPMAQIDTSESLSPHFIDYCLDFVTDFDVKSLILSWYVEDLSDFLSHPQQAKEFFAARDVVSSYISHAYGGEGLVAMFITDYEHWIDDSVQLASPCPSIGSYQDLTQSRLGLELLYRGSVPAEQPPARAWPRDKRARKFQFSTSPARPQSLWMNRLNRFVLGDSYEHLSPSSALSALGGAEAVIKLNASLADIQFRDRLLASIVSSAQTQWHQFPHEDVEHMLERAALGRPQIELLNRAIDLLSAIGSFSRSDDPSAYAVAAYLAWWLGDGKLARENVNFALDSDPEYSLAQLVEHALDVRLPPPWYQSNEERSKRVSKRAIS